MHIDEYYAVDYVTHFYIGRVLELKSDSFVTFKFLHSKMGSTFDWATRDDIDIVHASCIFDSMVQFIFWGMAHLSLTTMTLLRKCFLAWRKIIKCCSWLVRAYSLFDESIHNFIFLGLSFCIENCINVTIILLKYYKTSFGTYNLVSFKLFIERKCFAVIFRKLARSTVMMSVNAVTSGLRCTI